jgi:DNA polymerase II small subunit
MKVDPVDIVEKVCEIIQGLVEPVLFINDKMINQAIDSLPPSEAEANKDETSKVTFKPYAKEIEPELRVIEDSSTKPDSVGDLECFLECFQDRFNRISRLLRQRLDAKDSTSISAALESPHEVVIKTIGIVTDKRETSKAIIIRIEDLDTGATVIVPGGSPRELHQKAQSLLLDQVVCIAGRSSGNKTIVASDIIVPDIPERKVKGATDTVMLALTSDLHVGSNTFLGSVFDQFIRWLQGKVGGDRERELSGRIKYLTIAGDLVDGIGVYPDQERELEISDIYKQYRRAGELIGKIPDYIEVIVIPGNHDAVRQALPQPKIPDEFMELLCAQRRLLSLGNPSTIETHGVRVLLFHGRSLEDVIRSVPGLSYHQPQKAMEYLLKARHVAPTYGGSTPLAPEKQDRLIIESPPDIFHSGHIHVNGYETYRGTSIVNSGAWQSQTDYQKKMGLMPTPGRVPIVNLQNMHLSEFDFSSI